MWCAEEPDREQITITSPPDRKSCCWCSQESWHPQEVLRSARSPRLPVRGERGTMKERKKSVMRGKWTFHLLIVCGFCAWTSRVVQAEAEESFTRPEIFTHNTQHTTHDVTSCSCRSFHRLNLWETFLKRMRERRRCHFIDRFRRQSRSSNNWRVGGSIPGSDCWSKCPWARYWTLKLLPVAFLFVFVWMNQ